MLTITLGLASRRFGSMLPAFIAQYAGDTLWATAAYFGFALVFVRWSVARLAIAAATFALTIEVSQLYHAPWIDSIRATTLGGLILGFGFLWSDLVCYAVGVVIAAVLDAAGRALTAP